MKDYIKKNDCILDEWREKFIAELGADNEWKFAPDGFIFISVHLLLLRNNFYWNKI